MSLSKQHRQPISELADNVVRKHAERWWDIFLLDRMKRANSLSHPQRPTRFIERILGSQSSSMAWSDIASGLTMTT